MLTDPRRGSLRDEQRSMARDRVLAACVELAVRHGGFSHPDRFTYARIAALAGVSERTVYRLFPTKDELVRAYIEDRTLTGGRPIPTTAGEFGGFLRGVAQHLDTAFPAPARPESVVPDSRNDGMVEANADRSRRDNALRKSVSQLLPDDLTDEQRAAISAVIRAVVSIQTLVDSSERLGSSLTTTGDAFAWAVETLVHAIERGDLPAWTPTQS